MTSQLKPTDAPNSLTYQWYLPLLILPSLNGHMENSKRNETKRTTAMVQIVTDHYTILVRRSDACDVVRQFSDRQCVHSHLVMDRSQERIGIVETPDAVLLHWQLRLQYVDCGVHVSTILEEL